MYKIAFIGDFVNHGGLLSTTGTPIVFLLSGLEEVECIDVYCPHKNTPDKDPYISSKIRIIETYQYNNPISILKLTLINFQKYNKVIFNLLPTGFGKSILANTFGLVTPIILKKLKRIKNIEVIYHNSTFTNDPVSLGYNRFMDKLKLKGLCLIERMLFKNFKIYMLSSIYVREVKRKLKNVAIDYLNPRHFEALTSIYLNNLQMKREICIERDSEVPTVLLHGSWGPQKDLKMALEILDSLKDEGFDFKLVISGSVNHNFPIYENKLNEWISQYEHMIDRYQTFVSEKNIFHLFMNSDLLLLPYKAAGGHSGVLEQGIFFEVTTIASDFPEYREQKGDLAYILLSSRKDYYSTVRGAIEKKIAVRKVIRIAEKVEFAQKNVRRLLHDGKQ